MFSRLALRMLFAVLFVYVLAVLAAPTPLLEEASLEEHSMEKRSSGTVSTYYSPNAYAKVFFVLFLSDDMVHPWYVPPHSWPSPKI